MVKYFFNKYDSEKSFYLIRIKEIIIIIIITMNNRIQNLLNQNMMFFVQKKPT